MSAFFVASYNVTNQEGYQQYLQAVIPTIIKHQGEVLMADYEVQAIEGTPSQVNVIIKFASKGAANGWYNDPEYQAIKHFRIDNSSNGVGFIGAQFVPPSS